ncbi:MAG: glycosyltransferase, partial [Bacteroidia bacterium]
MDNSRNYLLVTACKNEAENLPDLIKSVIAQTIKPIVWVIVDDGSTDKTSSILKFYSTRYTWIHVIRLYESKRDLGTHYAKVVEIGFKYAIQY